MNAQPDTRLLDATFFALSDPTRRGILLQLARGEASVGELTGAFGISQPAISRHLKVLESAGLIRRGRDAQRRPATVDTQPMLEAVRWIERYRESWERTYQQLDAVLAAELSARKRSTNKRSRS